MRRETMIAIGLALGLAGPLVGCAAARQIQPSICDGKHRRPVNPYGSVLSPDSPSPLPSSTSTPPAKPMGVSAITPTHIPSCRS